MVTNFVGIQRDFTVPCGVRADVGIRVRRADGSAAAVGKATWQLGIWRDGSEAVATHFGELLPSPEGAGAGDLFWRFPVLEAGLWRYELTARGSDGEVARVFYGVIGSAVASDIVADGEVVGVRGWRMLEVLLPEVVGGKVEAHWLAGDYVLALCEAARQFAERAEDARDVVLVKFEETDAFIEGFWAHAYKVIVPNSSTGTWWVGGFDTGEFFCGENGKSPEIGVNGNWLTWSWETGSWTDSGTRAAGENGKSPYVDSLGFWVYVDPVTGEWTTGPAAAGKDGLDGEAVVRHVVEHYDDIPWSGETCNGGHVYYVPRGLEFSTRQLASIFAGEVLNQATIEGMFVFSAERAWNRTGGARLLRLGVQAAGAQNGEPSEELLFAHLWYEEEGQWLYAGVSDEAVAQVAGEVSWWDFPLLVVPQNRRVKVLLVQSASEPADDAVGEQVRVQMEATQDGSLCGSLNYVAKAWWQYEADVYDGYDVYGWVVLPDGSEGWVRTSAAYDLATADTYGLMKYGTDRVVEGGAPVGRNAAGQAYVPPADVSVPGAVRPSTLLDPAVENPNEGGGTHMGANATLWVDKATTSRFGAMRGSYNRVIGADPDEKGTVWGVTNCIGFTVDGTASVPVARAFQWGVIKVGTTEPQVQAVPFCLPIGKAAPGNVDKWGADIGGQLVMNLLYRGALRTYSRAEWAVMLPEGIQEGDLPPGNAFGLVTSESFSQSLEDGLVLNEATDKRLGGVKVMESLGSGTAVPTGAAVVNYLNANYYTRSQVYTKTELTKDGGIIEQELKEKLPVYAAKELEPYIKTADADSKYAGSEVATLVNEVKNTTVAQGNTISAVLKELSELKAAIEAYVKVVGAYAGAAEFWFGTAAEFSSLAITGKRVFLVLEN